MKFAIFTSLLALVAVPAIAQAPSRTTASADPKKNDVNRIVCQKEETIGSRLSAKRVCLTVKEWQDRAMVSREDTEQVQRGARGPSGN